MEKVIVTGASGFVGRNLIPYLEDNFVLKCLDRKELFEIKHSPLEHCDVIIHLAGKAHDLRKVADSKTYYEVNYELTKSLYDAFLASTAKKFIYISSVKAVADRVSGILTEDQVPDPQSHYGKSKLMAEEYMTSQPLPEGKSYFILRPCMIHGPGNKGNLTLLYQIVKRGIPYPLAGFENKRSFLSIQNLCFIIRELISVRAAIAGIYHLADDEPLSTNEVVTILSSSLHKRARLWPVSPFVMRWLAKVGDFLLFPLNTERLDKLTESYIVSNQKIKKAINKPLPLSAREGLLFTARFLNHPNKHT